VYTFNDIRRNNRKYILPMKTSPVITVLMPVYDCAAYVESAVRSVLDQTFTDFEFLTQRGVALAFGTMAAFAVFDEVVFGFGGACGGSHQG